MSQSAGIGIETYKFLFVSQTGPVQIFDSIYFNNLESFSIRNEGNIVK